MDQNKQIFECGTKQAKALAISSMTKYLTGLRSHSAGTGQQGYSHRTFHTLTCFTTFTLAQTSILKYVPDIVRYKKANVVGRLHNGGVALETAK